MRIFFSCVILAFFSYFFINFESYNLLILPKDKLNKQFSIIGSVTRADSINDQYARPLYNDIQNQFYFNEYSNYIILMQPNIGISYESNGIDSAINDRIIYRLKKYISFYNYVIFDISPLISKSFFYDVKRKNYFVENNFNFITDDKVYNIDVNYYDKTITYSILFHEKNNYKSKVSDLRHGYFITLSNMYKNNGSELNHLIARWDCNNPINIYIDRSVPKDYLSTFKEGIETWNTAFEEENINCKINAISYLNKNSKDFKYGDARYSTISLSPSSLDSTYAVGHIDMDWRDGRIFRGNIMVSGKWIDYWANVYNYLQFMKEINLNKTSENICVDKRYLDNDMTQNLFIKKGLKSVVIHEMGHILGLRHNFKASSLIKYENIFNKERIHDEGLIPSIMDYLSYIINIKNVFSCLDNKCIFENTEIMGDIGKYDKQTIQFGYGDSNKIDYFLGPDEMYKYDPLSNMGDISDTPTKYYEDDIIISKYIISNFHIISKTENNNFFSNWKTEGKLVITHINKLMKYIENCINIITRISYNFKGDVMNTKNSQLEAVHFLKKVGDGEFFIDNKKYFTYNDCDIKDNNYCQGMTSFDLFDIYKNIITDLEYVLNLDAFKEDVQKNFLLTNKTISINELFDIF